MTNDSNERKTIRVDIKDWEEKLGKDILVKILRTLVGLNRIYALWHLTTQTAVSEAEKTKARSFRNRSVSYVLTNGILHEIYKILQTLAGDMRERSTAIHRKIVDILAIFDGNPLRNLLTEFRDNVSFHINEKVIQEGLSQTEEKEITFMDCDSATFHGTYYKFAEDVSIYGFISLFRDKFDGSKKDNFEEFYKEKLKEFMLYNLEIQKILPTKFEELLVDIIDEFQLEAVPTE